MIEQFVLAQTFAVIGGDDHDCLIEHASVLQFVEQLTQPLIQISQAVVIRISCERSALLGYP